MPPQLKKQNKTSEEIERMLPSIPSDLTDVEKEEYKKSYEYIDAENKVINEYKRILLMNNDVSNTDNITKVLLSYIKNIPTEGYEMLKRYRDLVRYASEKDKLNYIKIIGNVARSDIVSALERLMCADSIYSYGYFEECYNLFDNLAANDKYPIFFRIEACKYLYISDDDNLKVKAQDVLISFIDTESNYNDEKSKFDFENVNEPLTSRNKYDSIILPYLARGGVKAYLNSRLPTFVDETFIYGLQSAFFYNTTNDLRDRILSANYIIQSEESEILERDNICDLLLECYNDGSKIDNNTKGDALDVVVRLGNKDQRDKALFLLTELGYDDAQYSNDVASRIRTFYNNTQNIHLTDIDKKLEKFVQENDFTDLEDYDVVKSEVMALISTSKSAKKRFNCIRSINRVERDTTKLTSKNLTLTDIFIKVWALVKEVKENEVKRELLEARMLDELEDMDDTCTTGHGGRFVNVIMDDEDAMKITWQDQITANISGRVQAQMNKSEFAGDINAGMIADSAEDPDAVKYKEFILEYQPILYKELYDEFVGGKYIKKAEFNKYFENGYKQWINYIKE